MLCYAWHISTHMMVCNSVSIFFDGCNWYDSIAMSNLKPAPPGGEYVLNLGSLVATLW